jgi:linoleate 10R-lipoxygenase
MLIEPQTLHALFPTEASLSQYRTWYRDTVTQLIKERSWKYDGVSGNYVDIVKSVINTTSVHWAADYMVRCQSSFRRHH